MNWVNLQRDYRYLYIFVHIFISFLHICRYNGKTSTLLCFFLARVELCCFFQILVRFNMDGCSVRFDACAPPWLFLYTHTHRIWLEKHGNSRICGFWWCLNSWLLVVFCGVDACCFWRGWQLFGRSQHFFLDGKDDFQVVSSHDLHFPLRLPWVNG